MDDLLSRGDHCAPSIAPMNSKAEIINTIQQGNDGAGSFGKQTINVQRPRRKLVAIIVAPHRVSRFLSPDHLGTYSCMSSPQHLAMYDKISVLLP